MSGDRRLELSDGVGERLAVGCDLGSVEVGAEGGGQLLEPLDPVGRVGGAVQCEDRGNVLGPLLGVVEEPEGGSLLGGVEQRGSAPRASPSPTSSPGAATPHQRWLRQFTRDDEAAVDAALAATSTADLADRGVDELSGGQRQRVWIALALAQDTPLMLLDEPTTFLDLAHQLDVLDLLARLNATDGRTIVAVLHDLNLACRYAHHLVAMRDGAIAAEGPPAEVVTADLVREVFALDARVIPDPLTGTPLVLPVPAASRVLTSSARVRVREECREWVPRPGRPRSSLATET